MTNAERSDFLKIKALVKAIDELIANSYEESENEINTLSGMLIEACDNLDKDQ